MRNGNCFSPHHLTYVNVFVSMGKQGYKTVRTPVGLCCFKARGPDVLEIIIKPNQGFRGKL